MKIRLSAEQIISKLRHADVELGKGLKVLEVRKHLGISEQTYYRWRTKYGGMDPQIAHDTKELEKDNGRLKNLVADQALGMLILNEAARPRLQQRYALIDRPRASASERGDGASSLGA